MKEKQIIHTVLAEKAKFNNCKEQKKKKLKWSGDTKSPTVSETEENLIFFQLLSGSKDPVCGVWVCGVWGWVGGECRYLH